MKKIILVIALAFSIMVSAQKKITEGKIIAKQTISTDNEQMQAQLDMIGKMETITMFKGKNSRSEIENPMSGSVTTIINSAKNEMLILVDNPALGKMYSKEDILLSEEDLKNVKVTKGSGTKEVLGYVCQEYITSITKNGVTIETILYTTEDIPVVSQQTNALGDKIKGFPLFAEMKMNQMGVDMLITTEVTKIEPQAVSSDLFDTTPPEGYKNMKEQ